MLLKCGMLRFTIVATSHPIQLLFTRAAGDPPIHLGRTPQDQCTGIQLTCRGCQPFVNEQIVARNGATFLAQIGPSGNERGYMAITGLAALNFYLLISLNKIFGMYGIWCARCLWGITFHIHMHIIYPHTQTNTCCRPSRMGHCLVHQWNPHS